MRFYSDELQKVFDTEEELKAAEAEAKQAAEKKALQAKEKKDEAAKIEELFAAKNTARKKFSEELVALRNEYNKAVREARAEFDSKVAEITKARDEAEAKFNQAVSDFVKKHPEGYHMTLKDGNNVTSFSGTGYNDLLNLYKERTKEFDDLISKVTSFLYI